MSKADKPTATAVEEETIESVLSKFRAKISGLESQVKEELGALRILAAACKPLWPPVYKYMLENSLYHIVIRGTVVNLGDKKRILHPVSGSGKKRSGNIMPLDSLSLSLILHLLVVDKHDEGSQVIYTLDIVDDDKLELSEQVSKPVSRDGTKTSVIVLNPSDCDI